MTPEWVDRTVAAVVMATLAATALIAALLVSHLSVTQRVSAGADHPACAVVAEGCPGPGEDAGVGTDEADDAPGGRVPTDGPG